MGTISDKLTYLNTTKSQLKDMINNGLPSEQQITLSTTFRNYVSSIFNAFLEALRNPDTLFTNLPKKSGTGANITLNDTANAPMRIELGASELSQAGTPTPSSPQDIHTISGSNKVVVCGKNLFDEITELGRIDVSTGQNVSDNNYLRCKNYINVQPNTTYYIYMGTMGTTSSDWIAVETYGINKNFIQNLGSKVNKTTFTTPNNCYYIRFYFGSNYGTTYKNDTAIIKGSNGTYEPYTSQEADIDLSSKNLLSLKNLQKRGWNLYFDNPMKEAGDYTISCESEIYVNPTAQGFALAFQNEIGGSDIGSYFTGYSFGRESRETSKTITQEQAEAKYIVLKPNGEGLSPSAIREAKTMLNKGNAKIPYVEYYEPIEYSKTGNYEDKFIRTSGKNLFDASAISLNKYVDGSNGNLADSSSSNASDYIEVKENKTYTISYDYSTLVNTGNRAICFYNSSKTFLSYTTYTTTNKTNNFTIPSNAKYIRLTLDKNCYDIMIYEGSTTLEYEPYGSNEWYIKKNIGKVVLDGSENISGYAFGNYYRYSIGISALGITPKSNESMLSNYFYYSSSTLDSSNCQPGMFLYSETYSNIYFISEETTATDFKTWLSTHNTELYYILATPTYTQIAGTLAEQLENVYQKLLSYTGQTNISQVNNDLAFNMSVLAIEE